MEPRQYKNLAVALLAIGILMAASGLAIHLFLHSFVGVLLMIIGASSALISLPTFMVLMMLTDSKEKKGP